VSKGCKTATGPNIFEGIFGLATRYRGWRNKVALRQTRRQRSRSMSGATLMDQFLRGTLDGLQMSGPHRFRRTSTSPNSPGNVVVVQPVCSCPSAARKTKRQLILTKLVRLMITPDVKLSIWAISVRCPSRYCAIFASAVNRSGIDVAAQAGQAAEAAYNARSKFASLVAACCCNCSLVLGLVSQASINRVGLTQSPSI